MSLPPFANEPTLELRRAGVRTELLRALSELDARLPLEAPVLIGADRGQAGALESCDPGAPQRVVATAANASPAEVAAAVAGAREAGAGWAARPADDRAATLVAGAAALRAARHELAALAVRECAKPWAEADADVCEAIDFLEYYAREAVRLDAGHALIQVAGEENTLRFAPRGVTAVISPWNFPFAIPAGMAGAALATGNTVVLKPAEQAPGCGLRLVELLRGAGVPPEALALVPGDGQTGAALVREPDVATIAFTGSLAVGREILAAALASSTRWLKRVIAELGGKNCVIVDADADLDEAVPAILHSAFGYAGQKCSACSRVLAHEAIASQLAERLAGGLEALAVNQAERFGTDVPPLIERAAQQRVERASAQAEREGRVLARASGAPAAGWFCEPIIVGDLPAGSTLLREEIFGPLLSFEVVEDLDAACATVQALPFALTAGLFSRNPRTVAALSATLPAGNLYVNRAITGAVVGRQPFGGNRLSGVGSKAGGADYLLQFVEPR
ncbi:MAG TPA: aldehyde dehydrogenase family protein, partial [Solirubrobacteraceae bacterium]|nr:aldehyde dehydrogenase family protein [Solirubrobacteraceae bacterium]